ncbi:Crp/Fnr family transcriptional regulator [Cellulophaga sp. E16_2]|uniref:Transcriptional regulator, Crp/Fnr family n=1 Tax=Cellulophaga algicola (strain DSM 14237 / IC166 / ACAM 630) TaxID=688270 RepID=E6XEG6_CELAD|nr:MULTISPECIES: Crp/Fnr family transcriptional regulator [Cellulophaga]ADV50256.1 transcriptional regulator, Crp/Fnr family [Cellulophaga algicola DSM 14237]MBO0592657.1 Crp/Fnr family transcriptional regulator [Cellulophaga sp. E16_2]
MSPENTHFVRYLESLKASSFFLDVHSTSLKTLLAQMVPEKWSLNTLKNSSDFTNSFHFIVSGRLKGYKVNANSGREHTIFILKKGDVFDLLQLMDEESHDIYWEAMDELEVLKIDVDTIRQWIVSLPTMVNTLMHYMAKRMRRLEEAATDISLHSTLVRLSGLLLMYMNDESQKLETINNLPNDEIARLIGTTRPVVNRHIQQLKKCGAISVRRKHIDVQNRLLLVSIAQEKYIF